MKNVIKLTFKEILNKKILHLGLILTLVYLVFYGVGLHYLVKDVKEIETIWINEMGFQLMTFGLFISSFLTGALAIMMGVGSISHEVESGTMLSLAAKPVKRSAIITGKFIVYAFSTALYAGILAGSVVILSVCFFNLSVSAIDVIRAISVFMLIPVSVVAPVFLGSVLISTMANGILMFMIYALAIIGGMMEQIGAIIGKTGLVNLGIISSLILPVDALYRLSISKIGGLMGSGVISQFGPFGSASVPSPAMLVYTLCYIVVLLMLAIHFFNKKDLS